MINMRGLRFFLKNFLCVKQEFVLQNLMIWKTKSYCVFVVQQCTTPNFCSWSLDRIKPGFGLVNVHTIVFFQMHYTQKMTALDWQTIVIANQVVAFKIISHLKLLNFSCVWVGDGKTINTLCWMSYTLEEAPIKGTGRVALMY